MQNVRQSATEKLIRSCLYNWLGYGNPKSEIWFVGTEEGGHEIWKREPHIALERSLLIRSQFKPSMDFQKVWRKLYNYGDEFDRLMINRNSVWRFIAAFYLYHKRRITPSFTSEEAEIAITNFLVKDFGSLSGGLFFAEFLPLPRMNREDIPDLYRAVWSEDIDYHQEVAPKRFYLIAQALRNSPKVKYIVSFSRDFTRYFQNAFPLNENGERAFPITLLNGWSFADNKSFKMYSVKLEKNRTIKFLESPFFSYMGYSPDWYRRKGLPYAATLVKHR